MAKKKAKEESTDGTLITVAKTIGAAAGKIAAAAGVAPPANPKVSKPTKKYKAQLPRGKKKMGRKTKKSA
jgi:hypothetical protein